MEIGDCIRDLIFTNISFKVSAVKHVTKGGDQQLLEKYKHKTTVIKKIKKNKTAVQKTSWIDYTDEKMRADRRRP